MPAKTISTRAPVALVLPLSPKATLTVPARLCLRAGFQRVTLAAPGTPIRQAGKVPEVTISTDDPRASGIRPLVGTPDPEERVEPIWRCN